MTDVQRYSLSKGIDGLGWQMSGDPNGRWMEFTDYERDVALAVAETTDALIASKREAVAAARDDEREKAVERVMALDWNGYGEGNAWIGRPQILDAIRATKPVDGNALGNYEPDQRTFLDVLGTATKPVDGA